MLKLASVVRLLVKWAALLTLVYIVYLMAQFSLHQRIVATSTSAFHGGDDVIVRRRHDEDIYPPDEINNGEEEEENTKETRFSDVQTLLLFIGYPRSGSTLLGSILDAHPNIVMANEYNLLSQWKNYTRAQKRDKNYVFGQLWSNSVREARDLQRAPKSSYFFSYHIPGTWQGRYEDSIKVIGDKKGTSTTRHLINFLNASSTTPNRFAALKNAIGVPVKFIHLVRNPFDNIATMTLRAAHPRLRKKAKKDNLQFNSPLMLRRQIHTYFSLVDQNVLLRSKYGKNVLDVHYTSFIRQPKVWLKTICDFLEVFCSEDYLSKCIKIIFPKETYTRRYIVWPDALKKVVMRKIEQVEFLNGLSFEIT